MPPKKKKTSRRPRSQSSARWRKDKKKLKKQGKWNKQSAIRRGEAFARGRRALKYARK